MDIVEWFDPHSREHLQAFSELAINGMWPKGFIPDEVEIPPLWHYLLLDKMAQCWISHALTDHV